MTRVIYAGDDRVRLSQKVGYIFKKSDALVCVGGAWYEIWVKKLHFESVYDGIYV